MRKQVWFIIPLIILIVIGGCKKKAHTLPDKETANAITAYAPIPSYKEVFRFLDKYQAKEISAAIPDELYKTKQEDVRNAFSLGVISVDAILSAKGQNKKRLNQYYSQMLDLTSVLGLDEEVNQISPNLKKHINEGQWLELETAIDAHKKKVEDIFWEKEIFDYYTLLQLGSWIEATNRTAWLIQQNYSVEHTRALHQKEAFQNIIANMNNIDSEAIVNQPEFQEVMGLVQQLKAIIDADYEKTYTSEQLDQIISLTNQIKETFQK